MPEAAAGALWLSIRASLLATLADAIVGIRLAYLLAKRRFWGWSLGFAWYAAVVAAEVMALPLLARPARAVGQVSMHRGALLVLV